MAIPKIAILAGDGIGPEIMHEAVAILDVLKTEFGFKLELEHGLIGGAAYDAEGTPLPEATLTLAKNADAVLLAAVGGPKWESLPMAVRPEKGLLGLRSAMGVFANLRPARLYPQLAEASTLKREIVDNLDIMIVRELTGGIYFGQPRGIRRRDDGQREGFNTLVYSEEEIRRVGKVAFDIARKRSKRVCSVDKANVLECTELWREVIIDLAESYPDVQLAHMYVDNAAMQLVRAPKQFDVMLTDNMFGDILSDCAAMLTGSIGMLPSASLNESGRGLYEPIHGSAPDIAGKNIANPLATILSVAMMLRYSFDQSVLADAVERAVHLTLDDGVRTGDIATPGCKRVGTREIGQCVVRHLRNGAK